MNIVQPKVFMVGYTQADISEVRAYLAHTNQMEFLEDFNNALAQGISGAEALCSMFGKLCYKSLVLGKNANVRKIREIRENIIGTLQTGHGSVFEHASFNFINTDVSRVFTHELVRHRAGTAFSQTSGRYCRPVAAADTDKFDIDMVIDPILDPVRADVEEAVEHLESIYKRMEAKLKLLTPEEHAQYINTLTAELNVLQRGDDILQISKLGSLIATLTQVKYEPIANFDTKKKLTSAMRRILPNGQANEIAFSTNIRTLRHCVQIRTQRFAEWEIREVFSQIYQLVKAKFPMVFCDAKERIVDGLTEVYGMRMQPFDLTIDGLGDVDLLNEMASRNYKGVSAFTKEKITQWANAALGEIKISA